MAVELSRVRETAPQIFPRQTRRNHLQERPFF